MITQKELHARAIYYDETYLCKLPPFLDYVYSRLEPSKGVNDVPRVVCGITTREYMVIPVRFQRKEDVDEAYAVVDSLRNVGYYAQVLGTAGDVIRYTQIAVLISWDPDVLDAAAAEYTLCDENSLALYNLIMQYVNAEKKVLLQTELQEREVTDEDNSAPAGQVHMKFGDVWTSQWVCLSIISEATYNEIPVVGKYLWPQGYRMAVMPSTRREGTWVLFVTWDPAVIESMPEFTGNWDFVGEVPENWV